MASMICKTHQEAKTMEDSFQTQLGRAGMNHIEHTITQAVEGYNQHHDTNVDEDDLLDPIIQEYSNFDSFDDLMEAAGLDENYEGTSPDDFDGFIRTEVIHPKVSCLHSLLTFAMNKYAND